MGMGRKPIDPTDPDKLQFYVPVLFSAKELAAIDRVAAAYGLKRGPAVRLMMREGAAAYDPEPSIEGN